MAKHTPTQINLDEKELMKLNNDLMDEVYLKFHHHQTRLAHITPTSEEEAGQAEASARGTQRGNVIHSTPVRYDSRPTHASNVYKPK